MDEGRGWEQGEGRGVRGSRGGRQEMKGQSYVQRQWWSGDGVVEGGAHLSIELAILKERIG